MPRGGKRIGAGRKKKSDPTVPVRIPISKIAWVKRWLDTKSQTDEPVSDPHLKLNESLVILEKSLKLKANAGGKIKNEIRLAIKLIKEA